MFRFEGSSCVSFGDLQVMIYSYIVIAMEWYTSCIANVGVLRSSFWPRPRNASMARGNECMGGKRSQDSQILWIESWLFPALGFLQHAQVHSTQAARDGGHSNGLCVERESLNMLTDIDVCMVNHDISGESMQFLTPSIKHGIRLTCSIPIRKTNACVLILNSFVAFLMGIGCREITWPKYSTCIDVLPSTQFSFTGFVS